MSRDSMSPGRFRFMCSNNESRSGEDSLSERVDEAPTLAMFPGVSGTEGSIRALTRVVAIAVQGGVYGIEGWRV